jgi:hypothetical protein
MQETTFVSLFSKCNVRKDAFKLVFDQICKCANDMLSGEYEDLSVLTIRVDLVVTRPDDEEEEEEEMEVEAQDEDSELVPAISRAMKAESCEGEENMCLDEEEEEETNELVHARAIEGESYEVDYEDYSGYGGNDGLDEDEEEMEEEEEEDNELVPAITRASEGESYEVDYEDNYGYEDIDGLEEDEEEMMVEEEINWFIPADKSCIEELEMVKVDEVAKCVICFEDFNVGVRLPCSHMFHANCIQDWLLVGNSCPLCRFQLPTANASL